MSPTPNVPATLELLHLQSVIWSEDSGPLFRLLLQAGEGAAGQERAVRGGRESSSQSSPYVRRHCFCIILICCEFHMLHCRQEGALQAKGVLWRQRTVDPQTVQAQPQNRSGTGHHARVTHPSAAICGTGRRALCRPRACRVRKRRSWPRRSTTWSARYEAFVTSSAVLLQSHPVSCSDVCAPRRRSLRRRSTIWRPVTQSINQSTNRCINQSKSLCLSPCHSWGEMHIEQMCISHVARVLHRSLPLETYKSNIC